jgi:hypothetical protein
MFGNGGQTSSPAIFFILLANNFGFHKLCSL